VSFAVNQPLRPANRPRPQSARTAGFTLVEMLVAVTLVVLMLMLFAQIFGDTVRIMREQNALAHNDQKARSVETVLRGDLARMSFRQPRVKGVTGLVPLRAQWPIDPERQRGYFYISENDIENDVDDVLQFTIDGRETHRAPDVANYKGRAATLDANAFSPAGPQGDLNQPDWDDGNFGNSIGESHAAEVVYFLRGGNLYRRQLLLREPRVPDTTGSPAKFDAQPGPGPQGSVVVMDELYARKFVRPLSGDWVAADYLADLDITLTPGLADFWNDFDYSAWNWWRDGYGDNSPDGVVDPFAGGSDRYWLMFNSIDSLKNVPGSTPFPIALPQYRFGHRPPISESAAAAVRLLQGQPVEYLLTSTGALAINGTQTRHDAFIGRYTHEETSSSNFGYPGVVPSDGVPIRNPMMIYPAASAYAPGWDSTNANSIIDDYEGGPRAGEDLILANVDSFDIEVWDDGLTPPRFVNLGHVAGVPAANGFYAHPQNLNPNYGPRLLSAGPDGQPGIASFNDDQLLTGNATADNPGELGWPYSDDVWNRVFDTWHPDATAGLPSMLMANATEVHEPPFRPTRFQLAAGVAWQRGDGMGNGIVNYNTVIFPGHEDRNYNGVLDPGEDMNNNGVLDPGEDANNNGVLDGPEDRNGNGTIDSDLSYYYTPVWVQEDVNRNRTLDMGEDTNMNGVLEGMTNETREPEWPREPGTTVVDGEGVIWQCFDNRVGLQMIRVTVRYRDQASGAPRQVSIIHSFVE